MTGSQKRLRKNSPRSTKYYPIYLNLKGRRCVIIGGGRVAERKCIPLIENEADITIISPEITERLEDYKRRGLIRHISRPYRKGDLRSAFLVVAATDSEEINKRVYSEAAERNILLNVVDNPELCNFIVPSVFERGELKIAISTGGISPAFAKRIRKELEVMYNREFSKYLRFVKKLRKEIKDKTRQEKDRTDLLNYLASEEIFNILRKEGFEAAKKRIAIIIQRQWE